MSRFELARYPMAVLFSNPAGETWYAHVVAIRIADPELWAMLDDGTIVRMGPNARLVPKP
jgi:hypothetical protein